MTKKLKGPIKLDTRLVTSGRDPQAYHGFVNPPVYHASTLLYPTAEDQVAHRARYNYGRRGTPTSEALENALRELDGEACAGVSLLQIPLAARIRVRLHRSRRTFRVNWPLAALLLAVAAVYVLARMALGAAGAPLPSTLAGLLMAGAYAAGLPVAQQMTARRLLAAR